MAASFPFKSLFYPNLYAWKKKLFKNLSDDKVFSKLISQRDNSITIDEKAYYTCDILGDLFSESERIKVSVHGHLSPLQYWRLNHSQIHKLALEKFKTTTSYTLRETLYSQAREATQFKCSLSRFVYDMFAPKDGDAVVLDPCAGWGDRMLGALASPKVIRYVGVDSNIEMAPIYDNIKEMFDPNGKVTVHSVPFEEFKTEQKFNLIFTSPPFFDFEQYENFKVIGDTYSKWLDKWLFPMITKMLDMLSDDNGTLVLYLGDTYRTPDLVQLVELHFDMKKLNVYTGNNKRPLSLLHRKKVQRDTMG